MIQTVEHTVLSAHDPVTGGYDAKRIAATLEIPIADVAKILGVSPSSISRHPHGQKYQAKLERVMSIVTRLREELDDNMDYVRVWLKAPHPDLDFHSPLSLIKDGRIEVVDRLIRMGETGQPG